MEFTVDSIIFIVQLVTAIIELVKALLPGDSNTYPFQLRISN